MAAPLVLPLLAQGGAAGAAAGGAGAGGAAAGGGGLAQAFQTGGGLFGQIGKLFGRQPSTFTQRLDIPPELLAQLQAATGGLQSGLGQFQQQAGDIAGQFQTRFGGFAPGLRTEFAGPEFRQDLGPFAQNLISQGRQQLSAQAGRQARDVSRRLPGGAGQVLAQQARAQARLQQNPLLFQAAQEQRAREAQEFGLGQQAQQLTNLSRLSQAQQGLTAQQASNAALLQQLQALGAAPRAQAALLDALSQQAKLQGTQQRGEQRGQRTFLGIPF